MADKQDRLQDSCGTHDLTIVPPITFGFVEDIIKGSSQSLGIKEVSKGYKYFSENSTDYILKEKIADENGRYLILTVEIDNTDFVFVNYYAPTKNFENDQIEYIEKLKILLNEKLEQNLVLGGDFNTILNPSLDKMGGSKYNTPVKYTSKLEDFIEEFDLCDIWRTKNVDSRLYTWRQRTPLIQCRLDFWLISNFLSSSVTKTSIVPSIKSDHSLIKLTLSGENFSERGPGFWKFNSGLLTDKGRNLHKVDNGCLVKGKCHRSQRKNESPHDIEKDSFLTPNKYKFNFTEGAGKDLDRRQKEDLVFSDKTAKLKQLYTAGGTSRTLTTNSILYPAKTNSDPIITDTITTEEAADSDSAKSEDGLDWEERHM
ncbi:unnamed protein product [Mytilus edulis]|uniref:Endonuclease/exonuclease/phosphatase domain-containing protein n=1 Tax=Mytilus edulis TaxID=6550 RepID=A0A8S3VJN0_MYTED|nr:unnamed protein product [Mytilus edulis]